MTRTSPIPFYRQRERFDPAAELVRRREAAPVSRVQLPRGPVSVPVWLLTRFRDARQVLGDAALYSNSFDRMVEYLAEELGEQTAARMADVAPGPLVVADPPEHTRLRRVLTPEFTVKRMRRLKPRVEQIVAEYLDAMDAHGGPVDLVENFALPVPSLVICELLGVPYADRADFQKRGAAQLDRSLSHAERAAADAEPRLYMAELARMQRAYPGSDLLGRLVLEHPDQWAMLRDDRTTADRAVEELLRYLSIVHHPGMRTAVQDTIIGEQCIAAGDMVLCSIPSANRDPILAPTATPSTSPGSRADIWPSVTASTIVSACRRRAWKCRSPFQNWPADFSRCVWPYRPTNLHSEPTRRRRMRAPLRRKASPRHHRPPPPDHGAGSPAPRRYLVRAETGQARPIRRRCAHHHQGPVRARHRRAHPHRRREILFHRDGRILALEHHLVYERTMSGFEAECAQGRLRGHLTVTDANKIAAARTRHANGRTLTHIAETLGVSVHSTSHGNQLKWLALEK